MDILKDKVLKVNIKDIYEYTNKINTSSEVSSYCRKLLKDGYPEDTILEVYREYDDWDFRVNSIGKYAKVTVREESHLHFARYASPAIQVSPKDSLKRKLGSEVAQ